MTRPTPISEGEVGKVGVAIDSLADMEILFDQIDLGKVSTSMTINAPASVLLAMYIAVAEKQGVSADKLKGTIQNDILKEYAARGTYIFPPRPSMRLITNIFEYCSKNVPNWNTISISGYHIREAGSTASQELHSPLQTASLTSRLPLRPASTLTTLQDVSPSSGTHTTMFSRKLRSSAHPAASGPRS